MKTKSNEPQNENALLLSCVGVGTADCTVNQPGFPSGIHGVPEGKWHQRPKRDEGDGLPGCTQSAGNLWRGIVSLLQQGHAEGGMVEVELMLNFSDCQFFAELFIDVLVLLTLT